MRAGLSLVVALMVVATAWSSPAQAQYKWRDAQGRITVSDRPPPQSVAARDILEQPAPASPQARPAPVAAAPTVDGAGKLAATAPAKTELSAKERDADTARKKTETDAAETRKSMDEKNAATMRDNCTRARSAITSLESGMRMARHTESGEREILDDKQRAAEVARAREIATSNCK